MTAPVEVTLHTMNDFSVITAIETNGGIPIGMMSGTEQTRYLRADLTCGECEHRGGEMCPHYVKATKQGNPAGGWIERENSPACMAFVPRATK